jgi:hypothetical protein
VGTLINTYKTKLDAGNTRDRFAADLAAKEIEAEIESAQGRIIPHHHRAGPLVHRHYPSAACVPGHHLLLESNRLRQGAGIRGYRSAHRHDRRLDRHDHHRLRWRALDREGRAAYQTITDASRVQAKEVIIAPRYYSGALSSTLTRSL